MNYEALLRGFRPELVVAVEVVEAALEQAKRPLGEADVTYKQGRDIVIVGLLLASMGSMLRRNRV
jgi:hypothetical protein